MSYSSNSGPTVNVAGQGDGRLSVDQAVEVGRSSNPGPLVSATYPGGQTADGQTRGPSSNPGQLVAGAGSRGPGRTSVDQPVSVGPSQNSATSKTASNTAGETVEPGVTNAGTYSPQNARVTNVTLNNVIGQTYGTGAPKNVYV